MVLNRYQNAMQYGGAQPCGHGLDTYQKHNVGNVGNVGYGFQVAKTTRTMHGHILTITL